MHDTLLPARLQASCPARSACLMLSQEVFFETNGVPRVVEVAELKAAESAPGKKPARERGDPTRPGSVSAPMSGVSYLFLGPSACLFRSSADTAVGSFSLSPKP